MNLRDPGEKGENFKAYIFATKHFYAECYGEFNGAIFIFLCGILLSKTNLKMLHMDIFEVFGRYELKLHLIDTFFIAFGNI